MAFKKTSKRQPTETKLLVKEPTELMAFLIQSFPAKSRDNIKSLLKNKLVSIDGLAKSQFNLPLTKGQVVVVGKKAPVTERTIPGLKIVHEDDAILVIEKPAGLLTMGSAKERSRTAYSYLFDYVRKADEKNRVFIVHRLDRETSGLLVFAKSERIKLKLQKNWNDTILERTYMALVEGCVLKSAGKIESYLRESKALIVHSSQNETYGQHAVTHYEVVEKNKSVSLLKLQLETGRKNQIRVHMQDIKHPVVGDKKYGAKTNSIGRLALHAHTLCFHHPVTNEVVKFVSKTPKEFKVK